MKILLYEVRNEKQILSLRKLEEMTSISKSALQRIESGKVSPTLVQLEVIAKSLNVHINDLYESVYK